MYLPVLQVFAPVLIDILCSAQKFITKCAIFFKMFESLFTCAYACVLLHN